ncbi:Proteasome subunit beta type-3 [Castilleja foliolosa]|uniref:Proteasome subunit beta type-3 n=1 Tax=Castilleja foliolosa TaxID=1961234 RepID=A0ABD3CD84_9LAMI
MKLQAKFKRNWVSYVGRRWSVFKTNLTTNYIYGKKKDDPRMQRSMSSSIKKLGMLSLPTDCLRRKRKKRAKAQEIQSQNKCPQRCSRGSYEVLTKKMMDEKYKARQQAADDPSAIIEPPSPPSHHETWKRALVKPSGEYINQETSDIAAKIDALEQEQSSGSFTPSGRNDILTVAIGKPDHPSRVRGVGKGYTVRTYFGKKEHAADGMVSREEVAAIIAEMKESMQAEMQGNLRAEMKMILSSQATSAADPDTPVGMSGKGSCEPELMPSDQQDEHVGSNVGDCALYVEDPHKRLVGHDLIHQLGSNLHNRKMDDDQVRVTVEEVLVADALVPIPKEEVTTVGEVSGQFIAWPRRLVVENVRQVNLQRELFLKQSSQVNPEPATPLTKTDVLKTLWVAAVDIKKPRKLYIEPGVVGLTMISLAINQLDIMGLLVTGTISVSVMTNKTEMVLVSVQHIEIVAERCSIWFDVSVDHSNTLQ